MELSKLILLVSMLGASLLTACGSESGNTVSSGNKTPASTPIPAPTITSLSGKVAVGYIEGAKVCLDVNANLVCDTGEPSNTTVANGSYTLNTSAYTAAQIAKAHIIAAVPSTAKDADDAGKTLAETGKPAFTLLAPATHPAIISPLTTMVSYQLINDPGKSLSDIQTAIRNILRLSADDDMMQDIGKIKTTDANVNVKNTAIAIALSLGELRKSLDLGVTAAGLSAATEQQKILATLNYLQTFIYPALSTQNISNRTSPTLAEVQSKLTFTLSSLTRAEIARQTITIAERTSLPIATFSGLSWYKNIGLCATAIVGVVCTPFFSGFTSSTADKTVSGKGYLQSGNAWSDARSGSIWSDYPASTSYELNTQTGQWVDTGSGGGGDSYVMDDSGAAIFTPTNAGQQIRVVARQADIGGKNIASVLIEKVPSSLTDLVFPAGSMRYFFQYSYLHDRYSLQQTAGANLPAGVPDAVVKTLSNNQTLYLRSLEQLTSIYQTNNTDRHCLTSTLLISRSDLLPFKEELCYTFDAGGTATGGTLTYYREATADGISTGDPVGQGSYEIRTLGNTKVLVITKAPANIIDYSTNSQIRFFSEQSGYAVRGNLELAGVSFGNQLYFDSQIYNKTALAAELSKLGLPAIP